MEIIKEVINQIPNLFIHPMLYVGFLLLILLYRRQILLERKLFSSRIHSLSREVLSSYSLGLVGGIIASAIILSLGIVIHPQEMWIVWGISLFLIIFNIRFLCLSYATGILGIIAGLLQYFNITSTNPIIELILNIHIPSLIAIVAILHLIESMLIRIQASKQATPLFIETKRGKLVGAYNIQSYWLLPLFLIVATGGDTSGVDVNISWWPLIGGEGGLAILPVPAIIGFNETTSVYSPYKKSRLASRSLFIYSLILLALAFIVDEYIEYQIFAAFFAGFAHELIHIVGKWKEKRLPAKYVHPNEGLMVLAVLPGSIAQKEEIYAGEVIIKANGVSVNTKEELYYALHQQPTFVKLEIMNLNGQIKFVNHSIYTDDHHQLGIILAPDEDAPYYIEVKNINIFKIIMQKMKKVNR